MAVAPSGAGARGHRRAGLVPGPPGGEHHGPTSSASRRRGHCRSRWGSRGSTRPASATRSFERPSTDVPKGKVIQQSPTATIFTPGMLLATLRLNIPTIFVSGGPMEAGKLVGTHGRDGKPLVRKLDLIDSMISGVERRQGQRRRARRDGAVRLSDLRVVLGHVHRPRQQHELPQRGARAGAARQRHAAGGRADARALGAFRRAAAKRIVEMALGATTSKGDNTVLPAQHRDVRGVRATRSRSTSPWVGRPIPCCTCWPWRRRRASTSPMSTSIACRGGCPTSARSRPSSALPRRGRAPRGRHPRDPGRTPPRGPPPSRRRAPSTPRPSRTPLRPGDIRGPRRRPRGSRSARRPPPAVCRGTPSPNRSASASLDEDAADGCIRTPRTRTPRTAAWRSSTATSRARAAS